MKCKCGGKLKRIMADTYQCATCGKRSFIAFAVPPLPDLTPKMSGHIAAPSGYIFKEFQEKMMEQILNAYKIPSEMLIKS
jgi:hypothetical protein